MKPFYTILLLAFLSIQCKQDYQNKDIIVRTDSTNIVSVSEIRDSMVQIDITNPEIFKRLPKEVQQLITQKNNIEDKPNTKFVVLKEFDKFVKGDTFVITTRGGMKGYPFYETLDKDFKPNKTGEYYYWVKFGKNIIPLRGDNVVGNCINIKNK